MKFGRVENLNDIDFSIPPLHPLSEKGLAELQTSQQAKIYIGCPVWADKGYVGKVFPKGTPAKNYLKEYCKQFNSIEVNATHYQIPKEETIEKWKEAATQGFKFCPKFPQIISHRNDFDSRDEWVDLFLSSIYQLDEFLGINFIQFPPFFKTDKLEKLNRFLQKLPRDLDFAIEFRHDSWFENENIKKEWFELFASYNISPVITDTAGRRDVLHQMLTNNKAFIRFTGNNLHPTDYQRIDDWVFHLKDWLSKGVSEIFFFMHEPEKHLCADIATYLISQFEDKNNFGLKAPRIYSEETGKLF